MTENIFLKIFLVDFAHGTLCGDIINKSAACKIKNEEGGINKTFVLSKHKLLIIYTADYVLEPTQ